MKERPILFSGPMVLAILEGRKLQTRRVVKPSRAIDYEAASRGADAAWACPYGQPGDRLWVRETWALEDCGEDGKRVVWQADMAAAWLMPGNVLGEIYYLPSDHNPGRWRPSIHMPRWASRLTLEVTDVRVQRLQEISEEDAQEEGITQAPLGSWGVPDITAGWVHPVEAFRHLWEAINGERKGCAWEDNPWLWCISFKVAKASGGVE